NDAVYAFAGARNNTAVNIPRTDAGSALTKRQKEKQIIELRAREEGGRPLSYSRRCGICFAAHPRVRAVLVVLVACGHTLCLACTLQLENSGILPCPFCRETTRFVKLYEQIGEEE
ncbi:hypothetical protein PENTCL1PPCAC_4014, partial [Pristionchus entomophagus]